MPYHNKFIKSLFISGVVFIILMALLSTTQMISGVNQQKIETGSRRASTQNSQTFTEVETKATQIATATPSNVNGPRITNSINTPAPIRIKKRAMQSVTPTNVAMAGATSGLTNRSYTFDASIIPISVAQPIIYVWQATNQSTITVTSGITLSQSFNWSSPGSKTITVTASNVNGTVSGTHNIAIDLPAVAPELINITGLTNGDPGISHTFALNIDPANTTVPITITSHVTDHDPITVTSSTLSNSLSFNWSIPGAKTIVVTVSNDVGSVSTTYNFTVNARQIAPSSVSLTGPITGQINSTYPFTATISPISTTQPITYVWQATDQAGTTHTGATLSDLLSLNWNSIGRKSITVVASNNQGSVSDTHQITILEQEVPLQHVTISGISAGLIDTNYIFTATVSPISTTQPITYVWQATDQTGTTHTGATLTDVLSLNWNSIGQKTITVIASNSQGSVSNTHQITILEQEVVPQHVTISGISAGLIDTASTFTATVSPISTTQPITYVWQATDQAGTTHTGATLTDVLSLSWNSIGEKTITVIASNSHGSISNTHQITISDEAIAPQNVTISGISQGFVDTLSTFSANVSPISTTLPITYVWEATGQAARTTNALTDSFSISWSTPGEKTVKVVASNEHGSVTAEHVVTIEGGLTPPQEVTISGPANGQLDTDYSFTANVSSISTTQPITYVWQATDQSEVTEVDRTLTAMQSFNWSTPGKKTITVIASNSSGTVTSNHSIIIEEDGIGPEVVSISGASIGEISRDYSFTANVASILTTQPITYVWQATDQSEVTEVNDTLTAMQSFNWSTPGKKTITVIASNSSGTVTSNHSITIEERDIGPEEVSISGASIGQISRDYSFTANVSSISTTQPITYVWQATDQSEVTEVHGTLTAMQSFNWSTPGKKTITVIASNSSGTVTSNHSITIEERDIGPEGVSISGPRVGEITSDYFFTATVSPLSTTQPLTYTWQATDQPAITHVDGTLTDSYSFNWQSPGKKMITVTVSNDGGSVTATHSMRIKVPPAGVAIDGLETGYVGKTYPFAATVSPSNSNQPITYTWESTDHEPLILFDGTLSDTQLFRWTESGEKMITVTAQNHSQTVSNTHLITIEDAPPIAVIIEGRDKGDVDTTYNFVATVNRSQTTVPLTYTWEAKGQQPVIRSSNALANIMPLSWTIEGPQMITVTAANHLGAVSDTHQIDIKRPFLGFIMSDSPNSLRVSETLTYFITVTNNAALTAEEAVLLDQLPEDVEFIDAVASQGSCSESEGDVTCELGTLLIGQEATIALRMKPKSSGRIINRANISSSTSELQVDGRTIAEDTLVSKPRVGITKVNPNVSFNDVPLIVYLDGFGFSDLLSVTLTGTMSDTLTGTLETVLDVKYVDPVLLVAEIPAGLEPGLYDITANTATEQAVVSKGYELKDFADFEDLYAFPEWFSTHPRPIRVGQEDSGISLTLEHLGGQETVENVTVEFRLDDVDGELLGRGTVASLAPSTKGSTELVSWQPPESNESKAYTLFAILDPDNEIEESDELNNVITRTVLVLPQAEDRLPPIVEDFLIQDDAQTVLNQDVTLDVTARDADEPGATGVEAIKFIEFEYIFGARRWVPIQRSPWITYRLAEFDYPWKMIPTFGMRYIQAWSVDGQGNISSEAGAEVIDLLPTEQTGYVGQHGVVFYRFHLEQGETFGATLNSISGDADLHVWSATGQRWSSNTPGVDNVEFEAPFAATYQIEVHGFSNAEYNLIFGGSSDTSLRRKQGVGPKPLPEEIAVPLDNWPEYYEMEPPVIPHPPPGSTLYLPLMRR